MYSASGQSAFGMFGQNEESTETFGIYINSPAKEMGVMRERGWARGREREADQRERERGVQCSYSITTNSVCVGIITYKTQLYNVQYSMTDHQ